jgi:hypothetical protein
MKKCLLIVVLSLVLAFTWGGEGLSQTQKEMTLTGTNISGATSKVFPLDKDHIVMQVESMGVRVDDSGGGPFHEISTHIVAIGYVDKGVLTFKGIETHMDKDGDKVIWEIAQSPGAARGTGTGKIIGATGKFTGWQGTMEYATKVPKGFPDGTNRWICREVMKITTK